MGNSGESTPTFAIVGFQARNKIDSQTHDTAIFDGLPISNAICKIGSKNILLTELNATMIKQLPSNISRNRKLLSLAHRNQPIEAIY